MFIKRRKFMPKCTKIRLAASLRPDPLGELKCTPDSFAAIEGGPTSKGREKRESDERGSGE